MVHISDQDRNAFTEAHLTVLDFTEAELTEISRISKELKKILEAAKERDRVRLNRQI
jgi:hypothetical protein